MEISNRRIGLTQPTSVSTFASPTQSKKSRFLQGRLLPHFLKLFKLPFTTSKVLFLQPVKRT